MKNLEFILKNRGSSMTWLAKETGISYATIRNYAKCRTLEPKKDYSEKIAKALNVTKDQLG